MEQAASTCCRSRDRQLFQASIGQLFELGHLKRDSFYSPTSSVTVKLLCRIVTTYSILVYVYAEIEYVSVRTYPSKIEYVGYAAYPRAYRLRVTHYWWCKRMTTVVIHFATILESCSFPTLSRPSNEEALSCRPLSHGDVPTISAYAYLEDVKPTRVTGCRCRCARYTQIRFWTQIRGSLKIRRQSADSRRQKTCRRQE